MTRVSLLNKYYDMACHNLLCYSTNYLMTEPKRGYENEWKVAQEEVELLESLIKKDDFLKDTEREHAIENIASWAAKNLICRAHAERFFQTIFMKMELENPALKSIRFF